MEINELLTQAGEERRGEERRGCPASPEMDVLLTRPCFGRKGSLVVKMHRARSVADTQMHVIARFKLKPSDTQ